MFVLTNIHSIEQLEVLLHLRRHRDREWTADAVSRELRTNAESAAMKLADLHARRFVARRKDGAVSWYRFSPEPEMEGLFGQVAELYGTHRVSIIDMVYSRPAEVMRLFADAFRLRKEDDE